MSINFVSGGLYFYFSLLYCSICSSEITYSNNVNFNIGSNIIISYNNIDITSCFENNITPINNQTICENIFTPDNSTTTSSLIENDDNNNIGLIIGITVGSFCLLFLIILIIFITIILLNKYKTVELPNSSFSIHDEIN